MTSLPHRSVVGVLLCAGVLGTAACTAAPPDPPRFVSTADLRGRTVDEASALLSRPGQARYPDGLTVGFYDLTFVVSPEPNSGDDRFSDDLVIVACYTDVSLTPGNPPEPRIMLGTIPPRYATAENRARARAREFDDRMVECPGTADPFPVPQNSPRPAPQW